MSNKECAIIIDGSSIMYRAYFATQINKQDDQVIRDFYLTLSSIQKTIRKLLRSIENYKYVIVTFDTSKSTFRKEMFEEYKSNRKSMPSPLLRNIENIKNVFRKEGVVIIDAPQNYEGDDAVATLATMFSSLDIHANVFSTDRDLLQLVDQNISVYLLRKSELEEHNIDNFSQQNEGLTPKQIAYQKALSGDSSDNYKGISGIGPRTAREWLIKYGDIENIYNHLDELKPSHKQKLIENKEKLTMFLNLSSLVKDLDLSKDLKEYEYKGIDETNSRTR